MSRVLIVTSVEAERKAVEAGIRGDSRFCVALCGGGPFEAGVETSRLLASGSYDLVINAGIGGGFVGRAEVGSIVIGSESIAAQLGAEDRDGSFIPFDQLGFGGTCLLKNGRPDLSRVWVGRLENGQIAPIVTVTTVTGTAESTAMIANRYPAAAAEAMEGFSVASAAAAYQLPFIEVRSISNPIGPRDRASWNIPAALSALTTAFAKLVEVME
jgi:futalosine hydrolase